MHNVEHAGFERILDYLRQSRGVDFTAYKRTSLVRRVRKRMHDVGIHEYDAYLEHLQIHPEEFASLFNTILINVTSFFRDAEVWETLREDVLPGMTERARNGGRLRVWSAGCASGQEAYSVAMLLSEALGLEAFKERVKIYATDVDEEALAEGRRAVYTARQVADVPLALREKYFANNGGELYAFDRELRRSVIFGRHDLIHDPPISHLDLLFCRNTLMYFKSDAQARIMSRFSFSTNVGSHVVLGRAEMICSDAPMFAAVDLKRRIFKKARNGNGRDRLLLAPASPEEHVSNQRNHGHLRDLAFETTSHAELVLDPAGTLVSANAAARRHFRLSESDIGTPLEDLDISYRPAELRPAIDSARSERRETRIGGVIWQSGDGARFLDVVVAPLFDDVQLAGLRVSYIDVTPVKALQDELSRSKQELDTAYEELQSTNEELETTNEELQSTVEELETTNEELQSTNEELETMNEELHSTNEELQTMNEELRNRSTELNSTNAFLEAVFTSLRAAVVVVDRDLRVQVWNAGARDMWGIRADEAKGHSFFNLDIGLPVGELQKQMREVLAGTALHRETVIGSTNRKGRGFNCRVTISALVGPDRAITGAILLMEDEAPGT